MDFNWRSVWERALATSILVSCMFCVSKSTAIEPYSPVRRHSSSQIHVSVKPKYVEFGRDSTINIRCRAKGGRSVMEIPFMSFSQIVRKDAIITLNSAIPGYTIKVAPSTNSYSNIQKTVKHLVLGKHAYDFLEYGDNTFYCKSYTMTGQIKKAYFVIRKV